jgi:hypothetical protein
MCLDRLVDGIHDLGGMQGFGAVEVEHEEPVFHAEWERRVFGMTAMADLQGITGNTSAFRHAIERMDPAHYLTSSYYEHWLTGLSTLLAEKDVLDRQALSGFPLARPDSGVHPLEPDGGSPRFAVGDRVRVRDVHTGGHTRCPRYIRGREGVVERVDGTFALPDAEAHVDDPPAEPTYCVRFEARELWGEDAEPGVGVSVDLWESYLEPAG